MLWHFSGERVSSFCQILIEICGLQKVPEVALVISTEIPPLQGSALLK